MAGCGSASGASSGPSSRPIATLDPSPSILDSRVVGATVFGFVFDSLEPADRAVVSDELAAAVGHRLDGMSPKAAETQLLLLASNGKFRLDEATLLRRLDLEATSTLAIDVSLCAQLARGELQFGKTSPAMAGLMAPLSPGERLEEARILVAAVRAEATGTGEPIRFPSDQRGDLARAMLQAFEPAEAARLAKLAGDVASGRSSADSDVCEVSRIPYRAAARLSSADRLRLARYILGT